MATKLPATASQLSAALPPAGLGPGLSPGDARGQKDH